METRSCFYSTFHQENVPKCQLTYFLLFGGGNDRIWVSDRTPDDVVCFSRVDGATDPDAEPDERATDGHAGRLVQRVPQVLRRLRRGDGLRAHHGVSVSI